ncbi:MAG: hypothetical protein ACRBN8_03710 [Nannocystales bacterium]
MPHGSSGQAPPQATATVTSSSAEPDGDESSGTTGGAKFDLPPGGDGPTGFGCAKVDFLFVVDNSGSMSDEQQTLAASFPAFMETIQSEIAAMDYHLMVVSTDGSMIQSSGGSGSQVLTCTGGNCTCAPAPDCCVDACALGGGQDSCFGVPCGEEIAVEGCDVELGAGRRFSSQGECGLSEEQRFITQAEPDLETRFLCMADVGTFGSGNEVPIDAVLAAIGDHNTGDGGCNDGFLRDDAVLVVTIITDEEDDHDGFFGSEGDPPQWHQAVLDAKGGNETAAVVLGLVGDTDLPDGLCEPLDEGGVDGAEASPRLREFVGAFGSRGFVGSVCAPSYDGFFSDAVSVIDTACDEFEPEG